MDIIFNHFAHSSDIWAFSSLELGKKKFEAPTFLIFMFGAIVWRII
jgi:hypothetical protein